MICDLCTSESFEFFSLGKQPLANKYPKIHSDFKTEQFHDVNVHFCPRCKNIQLDTKISRETMFVDYYYLSSVNQGLVEHYSKFACTLAGSRFVVDIGSNDGISLKPLKEMGIKALGVEPSENISRIANDAGLETTCGFFNGEIIENIVKWYGKPDVITGLSMFSHLEDPHVFLEDVKTLLSDDGRFIVEVEYNAKILENLSFERFYLDRIFYFSVTSFQALFREHGMVLVDAEMTDIHGGSLRVTAKTNGEPSQRTLDLLDKESRLLTLDAAREFGKESQLQVASLKQILKKYKDDGLKVAGYGCPARAATITNLADIDECLIEFIVDNSPLKQSRFSPGKHIPIVNTDYLEVRDVDVLIVFAFEYFEEIRKGLKKNYRFLFPIPPREV